MFAEGLHFRGIAGVSPDNFFVPNPDLKPETTSTLEAGLRTRLALRRPRDGPQGGLGPHRRPAGACADAGRAVSSLWGRCGRPAGAGGHWWIANTDSGTVVTYVGDTDTTPLFQDALKTVRVEPAPATPDQAPTPTGQVFSGSDEFPCSGTSFTGIPIAAPSRFLVVTEDGNLQCWAETGASQAERMRSFTLAER